MKEKSEENSVKERGNKSRLRYSMEEAGKYLRKKEKMAEKEEKK